MKTNRTATLCFAALSMILLILDGKTAFYSATQGLRMCIEAVIPSLFPFFFLSVIINDRLLGANSRLLSPLARACKIPEGSTSILLLGLIGGYPVGAATIHDAYKANILSKQQSARMLSFCSNAGPAFLFGMLAPIFPDSTALWVLWVIQISSALCVGMLMPGDRGTPIELSHAGTVTTAKAMHITLRNISLVCGWILIFRIILGFAQRWFLWLLPLDLQILLSGFVELSNGCLSLSLISSTGLRFLLSAVFLSFGGLCVCMQTASVIGKLPVRSYVYGKTLQTAITCIFAGISQYFLFPEDHLPLSAFLSFGAVFLVFLLIWKKAVAFPGNIGYNGKKSLNK